MKLSEKDWQNLISAAIAELKKLARQKQTISYGIFSKRITQRTELNVSHRSDTMNELLCRILQKNIADQEPLLPALVVRADNGRPGNGFFVAATQLLKITITDEQRWWKQQRDSCYKKYQKK